MAVAAVPTTKATLILLLEKYRLSRESTIRQVTDLKRYLTPAVSDGDAFPLTWIWNPLQRMTSITSPQTRKEDEYFSQSGWRLRAVRPLMRGLLMPLLKLSVWIMQKRCAGVSNLLCQTLHRFINRGMLLHIVGGGGGNHKAPPINTDRSL
jgi:hypothetical protein